MKNECNASLSKRIKTRLGAKALVLALTVGLLAMPTPTLAEWPQGQLRIIVPYAPGGTSDNIVRAIEPGLEASLKQEVVIENVSGGGGTIGVTRAANRPANGANFGFVPTATLTIAPHMNAVAYDPAKSFEPVGRIAESYGALAVRKGFPADTLQEFIDYAKKNPGKVTVGSAGIGTITHLYSEVFADATGVELTHIPFQGSGEAMNNLLGGHIDALFDPVVLRQAKAGTIKPLAILNNDRWEGLPEIPTMAEAGVKGFNVASWFGIVAPAGTSKEAVDGMSRAIEKALQDPGVKSRLKDLGVLPVYLGRDRFGELIQSDFKNYGTILEKVGLANK